MNMDKSWQNVARAAMMRLKINQQQIADHLGVNKSTVSSWFHGRYQPSMKQLERIAKMLDMTLAELVSEDDALARNEFELSLLRAARDIPTDKQHQAAELIGAILATLKKPVDSR